MRSAAHFDPETSGSVIFVSSDGTVRLIRDPPLHACLHLRPGNTPAALREAMQEAHRWNLDMLGWHEWEQSFTDLPNGDRVIWLRSLDPHLDDGMQTLEWGDEPFP